MVAQWVSGVHSGSVLDVIAKRRMTNSGSILDVVAKCGMTNSGSIEYVLYIGAPWVGRG